MKRKIDWKAIMLFVFIFVMGAIYGAHATIKTLVQTNNGLYVWGDVFIPKEGDK